MGEAFDLQGHRGARGLAPENSLPGFATALDVGVTTLETDLLVTRDGVVVLHHDPLLNPAMTRGPDGRWLTHAGPAVSTSTLAELQSYDVGRIDPASHYARAFPHQIPADGARIPTLDQLLALGEASGKAPRYNLEIKTSPLQPHDTPEPDSCVRLTLECVRRARLESRVVIQAFDWRVVLIVRQIAPQIATACLTCDGPDGTLRGSAGQPSPLLAGIDARLPGAPVPELVKATGATIWSPCWRDLDAASTALAHRLGLAIVPWTVNEGPDMAAMIGLGVDGLITDYPDRARVVLEAHGRAVRPRPA